MSLGLASPAPSLDRPRLPVSEMAPATSPGLATTASSPGPASPALSPDPASPASSPGQASSGPFDRTRTPGSSSSVAPPTASPDAPSASLSPSPVPPPPLVPPIAAAQWPHTRSRSGIVCPKERTDGTVAWLAACVAHLQDDPAAKPRHFQAALGIPRWRSAMEQEYQALLKNGTWQLVPLVFGVNIIDSKWVFMVKRHADGSIERYKAWLVAK